MNTQIHRKQIIMLILSMALAVGSYWIPLPPESHTLHAARVPEVVAQPTTMESTTFAREPMTNRRFPITVRIPQTVAQPDNAVTRPDERARPVKHLIELRDLSNGERNGLRNPSLTPIVDRGL